MIGSAAQPGIMHLTLKDLFAASQRGDAAFKVTASFLEVYNENIRDLLADAASSGLAPVAAPGDKPQKELLSGAGGYGRNYGGGGGGDGARGGDGFGGGAPAAPEHLDLREDPLRGPTVVGITEVEVATAAAIMALLAKGNASRVQAPTAANETSSRSHAVLQVVVENRETAKQGAQGALAKIKVSLAQSLAKLQLSLGS
jgi:kinesin family protein 18/19